MRAKWICMLRFAYGYPHPLPRSVSVGIWWTWVMHTVVGVDTAPDAQGIAHFYRGSYRVLGESGSLGDLPILGGEVVASLNDAAVETDGAAMVLQLAHEHGTTQKVKGSWTSRPPILPVRKGGRCCRARR